jgi:tyrosine-protein phosphatase YwqE
MHSHLLPGIDDGSPDLKTSIALIKGMHELGYRKLITTPHVMWDMYRNTTQIIQEKLELVKAALKEEDIDVELHAAAEYFLDEHVQDLLSKKEELLTISGNKVLVEFSMAFPSMSIKEILFEMQLQGYQPVIAHPERYTYLQQDKEFYDQLKDLGCLFQLNILSLGNHYGRNVNELASYLLKKGYYDIMGTDLHHIGHLEALGEMPMINSLKQWIDQGKVLNSQL